MEEANIENAAEVAKTVGVGAVEEIKQFIHVDELANYLTWGNVAKVVTSVIAILIFWIVYRLIRMFIKKAAAKKFEQKTVISLTKAVSYCFYVLIIMYVLGLFGIKLTAIWGAAGIAGVAIGFAAQTTVSNFISGIFVVTEKTMKIGDFIEVDGISGTVDTIGLLSVKIHTADNQLIRIPSSAIINTKLKNYSTYDFRRYVFEVSVDYATDLEKAVEVLGSVPALCPTVITDNEPYAPKVLLTTPGASGIGMNLIVWCKRADFFDTKHDVCKNTIKAFAENGINIPYNRVDVSVLTDKTIPSLSFKA